MLSGPPTPVQLAMRKVIENREWIDTHIYELIEEYPGRLVAVNDGKVVAHGHEIEEVRTLLGTEHDFDETCFLHIPKEDVFTIPYPEA